MPRKRTTSTSVAANSASRLERTTVFLPAAMIRNLDLLAMKKGLPKGEIVREGMAAYLRHNGLEPDRIPVKIKIEHSYS